MDFFRCECVASPLLNHGRHSDICYRITRYIYSSTFNIMLCKLWSSRGNETCFSHTEDGVLATIILYGCLTCSQIVLYISTAESIKIVKSVGSTFWNGCLALCWFYDGSNGIDLLHYLQIQMFRYNSKRRFDINGSIFSDCYSFTAR